MNQEYRFWKEGDIYLAENDWILMAYVVDNNRVGEIGLHGPKGNERFVEFISSDMAKRWDNK